VTVCSAGRRWLRVLNPGYSYLCSNDPRVHVGLGQLDRVDKIEVLWPDGATEVFPGAPADQYLTLRHGQGQPLGANSTANTRTRP
jgi:hypothetical protein